MTKINIVLFKPEIPGNTANIIRTCVGGDINLHLIKPYGFNLDLTEKVFKRGSTNYLEYVKLFEYEDFDDFASDKNSNDFYFVSRYGLKTYDQINVKEHENEIYYIFGSESSGIDKDILEKYKMQTFRIPMTEVMRSLNLSNCAAMVAYDGLRQLNFNDLETHEPHKINYLGEENGK